VWIGVIEEITERLMELAKDIAVVIVEQHLDLALRVATMPMCSTAAGSHYRAQPPTTTALRSCSGILRRSYERA
jgi:hypothetical protein